MATGTLVASPSFAEPPALAPGETMADLVRELGHVSLSRIRARPAVGTAVEQDVLAAHERDGRLCELVDGVLVEKPMGFLEARLAAVIIYLLETHLERDRRGIITGPDGMLRLNPGLVRIPDVCFIRWARLPGGQLPREPIPTPGPDLAVEVLSPSNTAEEMDRKVREYFAAGASLVWIIDPDTRSARACAAPDRVRRHDEDEPLDGAGILPGFTPSLKALFERAGMPPAPTTKDTP